MFNMDDSLDTHAVLCGEDYTSSCFRAYANLNGKDWTDEMHEDNPPQLIKTRWNQVISFVMTSSDTDFVANINSYINLESLIDYYIFAYVDCGLDALGKNQIYLTYDGNLFYASMYDMDSTWGLYWNGSKFVSPEYRMQEDYEVGKHKTSNLLFDRLVQLFPTAIKTRYNALRSGVLSEAYIKDRFKEWCDISSPELVAMDYAPETAAGAYTNMPQKTTNNYEQLSAFITARLTYVDSKIAELT
jgi:spore coat protein CotH